MNALKKSLLLAPLVALPFANQSTQAADAKLLLDMNLGITYEQSIVSKVGNIPFDIRNVPVHSSDYSGGQGAIQKDSLEPSSRVTLMSSRIGLELSSNNKKLYINTGLGLDVNFGSETLSFWNEYNDRSDMAERGYLGSSTGTDQRGTGTALTYIYAGYRYGPDWNTFLKPNLFANIGYNFSKTTSLEAGVKVHQQELFLETGWDRYDKLDTKDTYGVAKYTVLQSNLRLKLKPEEDSKAFAAIDLGVSFPLSKKCSDLGNKLSLDEKPALIIGVSANFEF